MKLVACLVLLSLLGESIQQVPAEPYTCNDNLDVILVICAVNNVNDIQAAANSFIQEVTSSNPNIQIGAVNCNTPQQLALTRNVNALQNFINTQTASLGSNRVDRGIDAATEMLRSQDTHGSIVLFIDAEPQAPQLSADAALIALRLRKQIHVLAINAAQNFAFQEQLVDITYDRERILPLNNAKELAKNLCAFTVCSSCSVDAGSRREPHPLRCDKFYMCERRENEVKAYEKNCGIGTLWHRRFLTCVPTWQALSDPNAGCGICGVNTPTTYPVADYCQIYYECGVNSNNQPMLNVNCCPAGQGYNANARTCQSSTCAARNYEDKVSCRGFYFCDDSATNPPTWQRNCCQGQSYNVSTQQCEVNNNCIGSCDIATWRPCDNLRPHPTDICSFLSVVNGRSQGQRCPPRTRYNDSTCGCEEDALSRTQCLPPTEVCKPDVVIPLTPDQKATWGFSDSSGTYKWIDLKNVVLASDGTVALGQSGPGYMTIPYFAGNDQAFVENCTFFRVSVNNQSSLNGNSMLRVVLDNRPCPGGFCEAGEDPSVWIYMNEGSPEFLFGVRTLNGAATTTINYTPALGAWKRLTMKYCQNPGLLEAEIFSYDITGNGRAAVREVKTGASTGTSGRILTSDCGMRIGQSVNPNYGFIGKVDDVVIYNTCKSGVPAVGDVSPPNFGLVP